MEERAAMMYSSNYTPNPAHTHMSKRTISSIDQAYEKAYLRPQIIIAPFKLHPSCPGRVTVIPPNIDIINDLIHPFPVCRGQAYDPFEFGVAEFKEAGFGLETSDQFGPSQLSRKEHRGRKEVERK
jgi:hypothetical protein